MVPPPQMQHMAAGWASHPVRVRGRGRGRGRGRVRGRVRVRVRVTYRRGQHSAGEVSVVVQAAPRGLILVAPW